MLCSAGFVVSAAPPQHPHRRYFVAVVDSKLAMGSIEEFVLLDLAEQSHFFSKAAVVDFRIRSAEPYRFFPAVAAVDWSRLTADHIL